MLLHAFNEPGYLEKLMGLDKLHGDGEAALESVDWDEEDEGGGAEDRGGGNLNCTGIGVVVRDVTHR
jgi:hypothetical protein